VRRRNGCIFGKRVVLIINDKNFVKQGKRSVGVARQYSGTLGKVGYCQITVTLKLQVERSLLCVGADLYLLEARTTDA
jgi:SRSO17 transposase